MGHIILGMYCWPILHIPECTWSISHNAPFRTEMYPKMHLFHIVQCSIQKRNVSQNATVPYPTMLYSEQKCIPVCTCSIWYNAPFGTEMCPRNASVPYPTMLHSKQKCAHFCSEWSIVGYGTGAFWDLWNWSIGWCMHINWSVVS